MSRKGYINFSYMSQRKLLQIIITGLIRISTINSYLYSDPLSINVIGPGIGFESTEIQQMVSTCVDRGEQLNTRRPSSAPQLTLWFWCWALTKACVRKNNGNLTGRRISPHIKIFPGQNSNSYKTSHRFVKVSSYW
jgi:hypothetical protein